MVSRLAKTQAQLHCLDSTQLLDFFPSFLLLQPLLSLPSFFLEPLRDTIVSSQSFAFKINSEGLDPTACSQRRSFTRPLLPPLPSPSLPPSLLPSSPLPSPPTLLLLIPDLLVPLLHPSSFLSFLGRRNSFTPSFLRPSLPPSPFHLLTFSPPLPSPTPPLSPSSSSEQGSGAFPSLQSCAFLYVGRGGDDGEDG